MIARVEGAGRSADGRRVLLGFAVAFFAIVLLRTAWISDAAWLTLRTVEHAAEGFGPRWNIAERIQVYDHPLWMLLLLAGRLITGEVYFTTLGISLLASLACVWIVLGQTSSTAGVVLAAGALALSPSFVTFSTSGLESPLLHLLVAAVAICALSAGQSDRHRLRLAALAGLAVLTHWTTMWLVLPILARNVRHAPRPARVAMAGLTFGPPLAWLVWSWWYYGAMTPNPGIASDAGLRLRLETGWMFLTETARLDPLMTGALAFGLAVGFASGGAAALLAAGVAITTAWNVVSGGHAMAGYGLTPLYAISLLLVIHGMVLTWPARTLATATGLAVVLLVPDAVPLSGPDYGTGGRPSARTHNARYAQYQSTGLLLENRFRRAPAHPEAARARQLAASEETVALSPTPGTFGIAAGPDLHVIDPQGRTDPLLARLPPAVGSRWRWGAPRRMPGGYVAVLAGQAQALTEPPLARLHDRLDLITRAPLTTSARLGAIASMRSEQASLVGESSYGPEVVPFVEVAASSSTRAIREGGLFVTFETPRAVAHMTATLSPRYDYEIALMNGNSVVATARSPKLTWDDTPDRPRRIEIDPSKTGTALRVRCGRGVGSCTLADVRVAP